MADSAIRGCYLRIAVFVSIFWAQYTLAAGNTPRLISEGFSETVEIINRLLFMGILKGLGAFPELKIGHDDWWVVFTEFTRIVEDGLPQADAG